MTPEELHHVVEDLRAFATDHQHVEAKRAGGGLPERLCPERLWKTLSAFANTSEGGLIVLGLDEENGFETVGVGSPKKVQSDLASMCAEMHPRLNPTIN